MFITVCSATLSEELGKVGRCLGGYLLSRVWGLVQVNLTDWKYQRINKAIGF